MLGVLDTQDVFRVPSIASDFFFFFKSDALPTGLSLPHISTTFLVFFVVVDENMIMAFIGHAHACNEYYDNVVFIQSTDN